MPIRRELRGFYPIDWKQLSDVIRFKRAKGRCESCGRPHSKLVWHLRDGRWWDGERQALRDGRGRALPHMIVALDDDVRTTKVVLATAHLDHDPTNNPARSLMALCQRCHILNDK